MAPWVPCWVLLAGMGLLWLSFWLMRPLEGRSLVSVAEHCQMFVSLMSGVAGVGAALLAFFYDE